MIKKEWKLKTRSICYFVLLLYFISISAYQLGTGFDAIFVRGIFVILLFIAIVLNKRIIINKQIKWCLTFWGFYFLSILWSDNANDTLYYINNFIQIIGISICLPLIIKNKDDINSCLKLIVFSLIYTTMRLIIKTPLNAWGTERIGDAIGLYSNTLGLRLSIGVLICLYLIHDILKSNLYKRKKIFIIFYMFFLILFIIVALFSGSKKALILIILGIFLFEVISSKGLKSIIKVLGALIIGGVIIFIIFNNEKLYSVIGRRLEKTILTMQGNASSKDTDGSLVERTYYIKQALGLFVNNPIVGVGGNNFVSYMRQIGYKHVAYSHNNYTELLATLGIIGFAIYYIFWAKLLIKLILNYKKHNLDQDLLFIIIILLLLVLDYANVSYINEFNIIILILAFFNSTEKEEDEKYEKESQIYEKSKINID